MKIKNFDIKIVKILLDIYNGDEIKCELILSKLSISQITYLFNNLTYEEIKSKIEML